MGEERFVGANLRVLVLSSLLFVAGADIFYMMPPYLAHVGARLGLDPGQIGTLAGIESLGVAIASLLAPLWISRLNLKACAWVGVLVCVLGNLATGLTVSYHGVLLSRFLLGLFGEGTLLTLAYAVVRHAGNVDRALAVTLTATLAMGALVTAAAAKLEQLFPLVGPLAALMGFALAVSPFIRWFPRPGAISANPPVASGSLSGRGALLALIAQTIWFGAPAAFWTFAEQVGIDRGLPGGTMERSLAIAEIIGISGSIVPSLIGSRWGHFAPIAASTVLLIMATLTYPFAESSVPVTLVLGLVYSLWGFSAVYQMALVMGLDRSGRVAVTMTAAQNVGISVGPWCAGELITRVGNLGVTISTLTFAMISLALYGGLWLRMRAAQVGALAAEQQAYLPRNPVCGRLWGGCKSDI
jgi:predicted MFS family arabinose efflux permease